MAQSRLVFLDSRDLRDLVLASKPMPSRDFAAAMLQLGARIILTFTNVPEIFGKNESDGARIERETAKLEAIPHVYVNNQDIAPREFAAAVNAFLAHTQPRNQLALEKSWLDTWQPTRSSGSGKDVDRAIERLKTFPLRLQVSTGMRLKPGLLRFSDVSELSEGVERDRSLLGSKRGNATVFANGVKRSLAKFELLQAFDSDEEVTKFAEWARANPETVCPGWRFAYDAYEAMRADKTYAVETNDIADWVHLMMVPYTTAATLDKQWRSYCETARRQRLKDGLPVPFFDNIVKNTSEALSKLS